MLEQIAKKDFPSILKNLGVDVVVNKKKTKALLENDQGEAGYMWVFEMSEKLKKGAIIIYNSVSYKVSYIEEQTVYSYEYSCYKKNKK